MNLKNLSLEPQDTAMNTNAASGDLMKWSEEWGIQLAYAITQDAELSEARLVEAVLAGVTLNLNSDVQFAARIMERTLPDAFKGFTSDWFFKLPVRARIVSALRAYGSFDSTKLSELLQEDESSVQDLLELSRLAFSAGKTWLSAAGSRNPECPPLSDGKLFARYLGNDLPWEEVQSLHKHFIACQGCRDSLQHFKTLQQNWLWALPQIELSKDFLKLAKKTVSMSKNFSLHKHTRKLHAHATLALRDLVKDPLVRGMAALLTVLLIFKAAGVL